MESSKACILYILLWGIYSLQGTLYASGSLISQSALVIVLLMSIYHFFKVNRFRYLPQFIKALNVLLLMFTVYGLVYMTFGDTFSFSWFNKVPKFHYLKNIYSSLLPIYSYYYFVRKGILTDKWISFLIVFFILLAIEDFYESQKKQLLAAITIGSTREEFTNNSGYDFCAIIPLIYLWRGKTWMQYASLGVCMFFVFMAMKRGAIVISSLCMIYFLYENFKYSKGNKRYLIIFITIVLLGLGYYYVSQLIGNSDYFQSRISDTLEGNSSGRDVLFYKLLDFFLYQTTFMQFIFGGGADYTIAIVGNYAHNDWLEIAICNGLIGLFIYAYYFITFWLGTKQLFSLKHYYYGVALKMVLGIILLSSFFSMSYSSLNNALAICIGMCIANFSSYSPIVKDYHLRQIE